VGIEDLAAGGLVAAQARPVPRGGADLVEGWFLGFGGALGRALRGVLGDQRVGRGFLDGGGERRRMVGARAEHGEHKNGGAGEELALIHGSLPSLVLVDRGPSPLSAWVQR